MMEMRIEAEEIFEAPLEGDGSIVFARGKSKKSHENREKFRATV